MEGILIDFLFILLVTQCYCWRAIEPETRRIYQFVAETAPPTDVQRVHLNVTKVDISPSNDVFTIELSWAAPHRWNGINKDGRFYALLCQYIDKNNKEKTPFLQLDIPWDVNRLRESFPFPKGELALICAIRPTNDIKLNGEWTYSPSVSINNKDDSLSDKSTIKPELEISSEFEIMSENLGEPSNITSEIETSTTKVHFEKKEMTLMELLSAIHESTLIDDPFDEEEFGIIKSPPILVTVAPNADVQPFEQNGRPAIYKDDLRPKKLAFKLESNLSVFKKDGDNICTGACLERESDGMENENLEKVESTQITIDVKRAGSNITEDRFANWSSVADEDSSKGSQSTTNASDRILILDSQDSESPVEFDIIEPSRSPDDKVIEPEEEDQITETSETETSERDMDVIENKVSNIEDFDEETQKKIKEDYETIESELRRVLEVEGLKSPRRLMMSSLGFGVHDRLL